MLKDDHSAVNEKFKPLTDWWIEVLAPATFLQDVRVSRRLSTTPCVIVASKYVSASMQIGHHSKLFLVWIAKDLLSRTISYIVETEKACAAENPWLHFLENPKLLLFSQRVLCYRYPRFSNF